MADQITCPTCGAPNQEVGKFCEQCGSRVDRAAPADGVASGPDAPPADGRSSLDDGSTPDGAPVADSVPAPDAGADDGAVLVATAPDDGTTADDGPTGTPRFVRIENGQPIPAQSFEVPAGATLLVGRADPLNGVFPEVDVTNWSRRVRTPDGELFTVHRRQCFISHGDDGRIRIRDCPEYIGDTLVSAGQSGQFRPIPSLVDEREGDADGAIVLEAGDRILMGQGEGMLIFELKTA